MNNNDDTNSQIAGSQEQDGFSDAFLQSLMPPTSFVDDTLSIQELIALDDTLVGIPHVKINDSTYPVLGNFALTAKIGEGGMGSVYSAFEITTQQQVAIKILPNYLARKDPQLIPRLHREAVIASKTASPHLVRVFEIQQASGHFFLVMELVRGVSAGNYAKRVREQGFVGLPEREAIEICLAATTGLIVAHRAGIVHRDIKPDNILLPGDSPDRIQPLQAKLADLGLACCEALGHSLTGTQMTMGTPGFIAPEQARSSSKAERRSDIFSMGATLYALLAGRPPHLGATPLEAILAVLQNPHTPLEKFRPDVSTRTVACIERCLNRSAKRRFQGAEELADELTAILHEKQNWLPQPPRLSSINAAGWITSPTDTALESGSNIVDSAHDWAHDVQKFRNLVIAGVPAEAAKALAALKSNAGPQDSRAEEIRECERLLNNLLVNALLAEVQASIDLGDLNEAESKTIQAMSILPDHVQARQTYENIQIRRREVQCRIALDEVRILLRDEKSDGRLYFVRLPKRELIKGALQRARQLRPDHPELLELESMIGPPDELYLDLGAGTKLAFVVVPAGEVEMGSDEGPAPVQRVKLERSYYVSKYPITVDQFRRFVESEKYRTYAERQTNAASKQPTWLAPGFSQRESEPAVQIAWYDARAFCAWVQKKTSRAARLPTEAEWEYAARGPKRSVYPWGDTWDGTLVNHADRTLRNALKGNDQRLSFSLDVDGHAFTSPVGALKNSSWSGIYDLAGNVWEWCEDVYLDHCYVAANAASTTSRYRVLRGGSWRDPPELCRAFSRMGSLPDYRDSTIGFRVVIEL
jgi:formylglycine-generating enzyme required for sulfatase activity